MLKEKYSSYTESLKMLNIETLEARMEGLCLKFSKGCVKKTLSTKPKLWWLLLKENMKNILLDSATMKEWKCHQYHISKTTQQWLVINSYFVNCELLVFLYWYFYTTSQNEQ